MPVLSRWWRARPRPSPAPSAAAPPPLPPPLPTTTTLLHLRSGYGTWLVTDGPTGQVVPDASPDGATRLLCMLGAADPTIAFLVAADGARFRIERDSRTHAAALPARLQRTAEPTIVRLRHAIEPRFCLGVSEDASRLVNWAMPMTASLGRLWTYPADRALASPAALALLDGLARATASRLTGFRLVAGLREGWIAPALAAALIGALSPDALEALARHLLVHDTDRALIARAVAGCPFATQALPALATWEPHRPQPPPVLLSPPADDAAAVPSNEETRVPPGVALLAVARRTIEPRRGACIVATARSEGIYLVDWLAHHRALGFEHVFLYTNDNEDGSDALLGALAQGGAITWIRNELATASLPQFKAYGHAFKLLPQLLDYRWAAVIDLDEYVGLTPGLFGSIDAFLGWMETDRTDAIALCWLLYASAATDAFSVAPLAGRCPRREPGVNPHVKSLCRPRLFWDTQMHFPRPTLDAPFLYRDERGELHHHAGVQGRIPAFAAQPRADRAFIAHYFLRSAPEALLKVARGRADWGPRAAVERGGFLHFVIDQFVRLAATATVEDRRVLDCAPGAPAVAAQLRALPGVGEAEARVREATQARVRQIVTGFAALPDGADEPPAFAAFRAALRCSM